MNEKPYVVPPEMLKAAERYVSSNDGKGFAKPILYAAIRWLDGELEKLLQQPYPTSGEFYIEPSIADDYGRHGNNKAIESVRRIFLAREPEMIGQETLGEFCSRYRTIGEAILEAYRRGKESK